MLEHAEHRSYSRSPVNMHGEVRLESGIVLEGHASDISLTGILFVTERVLPMGNQVRVDLVYTEGEETRRLILRGVVARVDDGALAIQFASVDDENLRILRRLILQNAPDAERAEAEIMWKPSSKRFEDIELPLP
jgi:hypothetical protein